MKAGKAGKEGKETLVTKTSSNDNIMQLNDARNGVGMNSTLTIRMDSELKRQFNEVLEEIGLDAPTAVRMLAVQTVKTRKVPLSMSATHSETDTLLFLDSIRADWGEW